MSQRRQLFRFYGPDSNSDIGNFEIIVRAINSYEGRLIATKHLEDNNRSELSLIHDVNWKPNEDVLYSNLEKRSK